MCGEGRDGNQGHSQQAQKRIEPGNTMAGLSREGYLGEQPSPWAGEFGVGGRCTSKGDPVTERDWGMQGEPSNQVHFDTLNMAPQLFIRFET